MSHRVISAPRADRRRTKGLSPLQHWGATKGVPARTVATLREDADKRHKVGEEPPDVDGDSLHPVRSHRHSEVELKPI